jgi:hypothetical protein
MARSYQRTVGGQQTEQFLWELDAAMGGVHARRMEQPTFTHHAAPVHQTWSVQAEQSQTAPRGGIAVWLGNRLVRAGERLRGGSAVTAAPQV